MHLTGVNCTDIFFAFVSSGRDRQMFAADVASRPKAPVEIGLSTRSKVNRHRHCRDFEFPASEELLRPRHYLHQPARNWL